MSQMAQPPTLRSTPSYEETQLPEKSGRKTCGCFCCGCLVILGVIAGLMAFGIYTMNALVGKAISEQIEPLAEVQADPAAYDEVAARISAFEEATSTDQPAELELSAEDLNHFLVSDPEADASATYYRFEIKEDMLYTDIAYPVDDLLEGQFYAGHFWNARIGWKLGLTNNRFTPAVVSYLTRGTSALDETFSESEGRDFMREFTKDPGVHDLLLQKFAVDLEALNEFFESADEIEVKEGKLILRAQ